MKIDSSIAPCQRNLFSVDKIDKTGSGLYYISGLAESRHAGWVEMTSGVDSLEEYDVLAHQGL